MATLVLLLLAIVLGIIIWKAIKPYTIKYDHTLSLTGGNGSGKTLTGVKTAVVLLRKARFHWWFNYVFKLKIQNKIRNNKNKRIEKYNKKHPDNQKQKLVLLKPIPKPEIYSTIPILFKPHFWTSKYKREWACKIKLRHLTCLEEIAQNSIVLLDELPQLVNQYNWDIDVIQNNFSEFASLHRHYYNSMVIITSQAVQEIVAQIRRKANITTWCFNFRPGIWPLNKLYYKISCCDLMTNDQVSTTATTMVEENTRTYYSFFPPKDTYDSRCYSERINNILYKCNENNKTRYNKLKTNEILHFDMNKISALDDHTTKSQKLAMENKIKPKGTQQELNKLLALEKGATKDETRPQKDKKAKK